MEQPLQSLQFPGVSEGTFDAVFTYPAWRYVYTRYSGVAGMRLIRRTLREYLRENKIKERYMARQTKDIKIQDVLELLKKGYVRYKKDDEGFGSIQEHYNLTGVEVAELAKHPKLRGIKTKFPSRIRFIDEDEARKEEPKQEEKKDDEVFS